MSNIPLLLQSNSIIGEGCVHLVKQGNTDYVWKMPKDDKLLLEEAIESLRIISQYFEKFSPPTRILISDGTYYVIQKKIQGRRLGDIPESEITQEMLLQLLEMLEIYTNVLNLENIHIDLMGPVATKIGKYLEGLKEKTNIVRKVYVLLTLSNLLKSINIIADKDNTLFLVDNVGSTRKQSTFNKYEKKLLVHLQKNSVQRLLDSDSKNI